MSWTEVRAVSVYYFFVFKSLSHQFLPSEQSPLSQFVGGVQFPLGGFSNPPHSVRSAAFTPSPPLVSLFFPLLRALDIFFAALDYLQSLFVRSVKVIKMSLCSY